MQATQIRSSTHCRLWQVDLDAPPAPQAVAALSDAEWERARRFVFKKDRDRFVAAHAALRDTLAAQTEIPAALLEFSQGAFGKPSLAERPSLRFNLSHSHSLGLIAVCDSAEIGVDIELLRPMPDAEALAHSYFSDAERLALGGLAPELRERAFLTCWTRKEACLKATGMGLSVDTRSFEVGVSPDAREVSISTVDSEVRLALESFDDIHGATCAVARVLVCEQVVLPRRLVADKEIYA